MRSTRPGVFRKSFSHRHHWKKADTIPPDLSNIFHEVAGSIIKKSQTTVSSLKPSRFPPLTRPIPNLPLPQKDASTLPRPSAIISNLSNGVTITSEELYEQMAYVGVFVEAGSRYESEDISKRGSSLLVEQCGFKGSMHRPPAVFVNELERLGANVLTTHDRELIVYYIETLRDFLPNIMEILAETVIYPNFSDENMENYMPAAQWEYETLSTKYDQLITELHYQTAYFGDPLGISKMEMLSNLSKLKPADLRDHHKKHFVGSNVTISCASVDADRAVKYANQFFSDVPKVKMPRPRAVYTGGLLKYELPDTEPNEYISLGFQCPGWEFNDDAVIICL